MFISLDFIPQECRFENPSLGNLKSVKNGVGFFFFLNDIR